MGSLMASSSGNCSSQEEIRINAENKIYRSADNDDNRIYATSTLTIGNRYVTIPVDLRIISYVQHRQCL